MKLCLPMKARSLTRSQLSRRRAVPGGWLGAGGTCRGSRGLLSPRLPQASPKDGGIGRAWVVFGPGSARKRVGKL